MTPVQHEVAVHLLANAIRRSRQAAQRSESARSVAGAALLPGRVGGRDGDQYLRGMLDLLTALYGRPATMALYDEALAMELGT